MDDVFIRKNETKKNLKNEPLGMYKQLCSPHLALASALPVHTMPDNAPRT
jgi:hypothetical protein